jgi:hypothetical protein
MNLLRVLSIQQPGVQPQPKSVIKWNSAMEELRQPTFLQNPLQNLMLYNRVPLVNSGLILLNKFNNKEIKNIDKATSG